jgi:hypothetical protein
MPTATERTRDGVNTNNNKMNGVVENLITDRFFADNVERWQVSSGSCGGSMKFAKRRILTIPMYIFFIKLKKLKTQFVKYNIKHYEGGRVGPKFPTFVSFLSFHYS